MTWVEVDGAGWRWVHGLVIPLSTDKTAQLFFAMKRKFSGLFSF